MKVEISSKYEETLQGLVKELGIVYELFGNGTSFDEFYDNWKRERLQDPDKEHMLDSGKRCYMCGRHVYGETLVIKESTGPLSNAFYGFHSECFDTLVMNHFGTKVIDGGW